MRKRKIVNSLVYSVKDRTNGLNGVPSTVAIHKRLLLYKISLSTPFHLLLALEIIIKSFFQRLRNYL